MLLNNCSCGSDNTTYKGVAHGWYGAPPQEDGTVGVATPGEVGHAGDRARALNAHERREKVGEFSAGAMQCGFNYCTVCVCVCACVCTEQEVK